MPGNRDDLPNNACVPLREFSGKHSIVNCHSGHEPDAVADMTE